MVGDYTAVIEALINKKVDVALLGPFSYVSAHARDSAIVPFAVGVRVDTHTTTYHSVIVVSNELYKRRIENLSSLKSHAKEITFAFWILSPPQDTSFPKPPCWRQGSIQIKTLKKLCSLAGMMLWSLQ